MNGMDRDERMADDEGYSQAFMKFVKKQPLTTEEQALLDGRRPVGEDAYAVPAALDPTVPQPWDRRPQPRN